MGGNALKNCITRRYTADEYFLLCTDVIQMLESDSVIQNKRVIPAYTTKPTFGDADILYSTTHDYHLTATAAKAIFPDSKQIVQNTDVISLEHREFQVDLIHAPALTYEYAYNYFSWNDCGNLVGKIARRFGLKHGHRGLTLPLRDGDNEFAEILITADHSAMLRFLDLDVDQFAAGFNTLEDMFDWVSSSKYFNPSSYALENVSHYGRTRDKKRATYQEFLKWLGGWSAPALDMSSDKQYYLEQIFDSFPSAYSKYSESVRNLAVQKYLRTKFNGELVASLTGLQHKPLGVFMSHLRQQFFCKPEVLIHLSETQINQRILDCFNEISLQSQVDR